VVAFTSRSMESAGTAAMIARASPIVRGGHYVLVPSAQRWDDVPRKALPLVLFQSWAIVVAVGTLISVGGHSWGRLRSMRDLADC